MTKEMIQELRQWTMLTNKLSEWHFDNLKQYPFIAFKNVKSIKIEYDIEKKENNKPYVRYILTSKGKLGSSTKEIEKRIMDCTRWVQSILWSDIDVFFVKENGKPIVTKRKKTTRTTAANSAKQDPS